MVVLAEKGRSPSQHHRESSSPAAHRAQAKQISGSSLQRKSPQKGGSRESKLKWNFNEISWIWSGSPIVNTSDLR